MKHSKKHTVFTVISDQDDRYQKSLAPIKEGRTEAATGQAGK
jgi:hypothetical protein